MNFPPIAQLFKSIETKTKAQLEVEKAEEIRLKNLKIKKFMDILSPFKIKGLKGVKELILGLSLERYVLDVIPNEFKIRELREKEQELAVAFGVEAIKFGANRRFYIDLPSGKRGILQHSELMSYNGKKYKNSKKIEDKFKVPIGKSPEGDIIELDILKMPHGIISGSTGSGKSVCTNAIISSLISRLSPDDLQLVLIDPKRVELAIYRGLPHLYMPVITDMAESVDALKMVEAEMRRRNEIMETGDANGRRFRNIELYNEYLISIDEKPMPYILVIIDELADLMVYGNTIRERGKGNPIETIINTIAAVARAAGIHLLLATQRPSTDVITGTIKNNIPARIAFKVASSIDSRTILGENGAEKLFGRGDGLLKIDGEAVRFQGSFIEDEEVENLVDWWSTHKTKENNTETEISLANLPLNEREAIEAEMTSQLHATQHDTENDNELIKEVMETLFPVTTENGKKVFANGRFYPYQEAQLLPIHIMADEAYFDNGDKCHPYMAIDINTILKPSYDSTAKTIIANREQINGIIEEDYLPIQSMVHTGAETTSSVGIISFNDINLENAIRETLKISRGRPITKTVLCKLISLNAKERGIADLGGIENCINLTRLNVAGNNISNVAPLLSLKRLALLDISRNRLESTLILSKIQSLRSLGMCENRINDFSPLNQLPKLTMLYLKGNSGNVNALEPIYSRLEKKDFRLGSNINQNKPIVFQCEHFGKAVRRTLVDLGQIRNTSDVYASELLKINTLVIENPDCSSVREISMMKNLRQLFIAGDAGSPYNIPLRHIEEIGKLKRLNLLYISDKEVEDVSFLQDISGLTELSLVGNTITNIESLSHLTHLKKLYLDGNPISSYMPTESYYYRLADKDFELTGDEIHEEDFDVDDYDDDEMYEPASETRSNPKLIGITIKETFLNLLKAFRDKISPPEYETKEVTRRAHERDLGDRTVHVAATTTTVRKKKRTV